MPSLHDAEHLVFSSLVFKVPEDCGGSVHIFCFHGGELNGDGPMLAAMRVAVDAVIFFACFGAGLAIGIILTAAAVGPCAHP